MFSDANILDVVENVTGMRAAAVALGHSVLTCLEVNAVVPLGVFYVLDH